MGLNKIDQLTKIYKWITNKLQDRKRNIRGIILLDLPFIPGQLLWTIPQMDILQQQNIKSTINL